MREILMLLLGFHGAIHALGFVTRFGVGGVSELHTPLGPGMGLLWLAAGILFVAGAILLVVLPRFWWVPALAGVLLSQALIFGAWGDAKFGTLVNLLILLPLALAALGLRPAGLRPAQ